ncbi:MAG: UDP-N-acetylmuramoyl-L-alanyl-D-glutamate--2,6-diaminopimelate ligase, partial [Cytophagales bacterium]|nr:UDP-N-acetylmuramoyl-L-alanyl-D-glutamate--2,6-diaminopimelate ligase [Cytophagales bacterium]
MAVLSNILYKVPMISVAGKTDVEINAIQFDSRKIKSGDLFVAIKGTESDGHSFIEKAIEKGAVAVVCQDLPQHMPEGVVFVGVQDSAKALGIMASNYFDNPSKKLKIVAVTGTNGKTTVATLLFRLFRGLGYKVGLLSTVQNQIDDEVIPSTHTTPDALSLNMLLFGMVENECTHCFMEASSHAIHQERISGIKLDGTIFTNITHDHLDYHKTFENYIAAKKKLFDDQPKDSFAIVNADDKRGRVMIQNTKAKKYTYGLKSPSDFKAKLLTNSLEGLELEINNMPIWFKLIGSFNAYNLLSVYAAAVLLGEDDTKVLQILSNLEPPKGRFERVISKTKIIGIVDYAHTPDALLNILTTVNHLREGSEQIITVVGCGGNRDAAKRPIMADIACKYSNKVILTSDNPRDEDPQAIIDEMLKGVNLVSQRKTLAILDRKEAIKVACSLAGEKGTLF